MGSIALGSDELFTRFVVFLVQKFSTIHTLFSPVITILPAAHRQTESPETTERWDQFLKRTRAFSVPNHNHSVAGPLQLFPNLRRVLKAASNLARAVKAAGSKPQLQTNYG